MASLKELLFLTLRKAPPLHVQKVRPDTFRNIASLVKVDVFLKTSEATFALPPTSQVPAFSGEA